jgi:hypothetical protein
MKTMNVGILTYHDINNYGAQLQAASLQQFLQISGIEAEIVDFRPIKSRVRLFRGLIKPLIKLQPNKFNTQISKRYRFARSILELANVSSDTLYLNHQVERYCQKYDVLICGSDELWNFQNDLGYQPAYILDLKLNNTRKISYAASMGSCKPDKLLEQKMKRSLVQFEKILVRDPQTYEFVNRVGLEASRVVDPTYLIDLKVPELNRNPYMVISGGLERAQVEKAVKVANKLNLEPISIGYCYDGYEDIAIYPNVAEWVSYIKNSSFHFTSLFHGAAFSIKSRKPFVIISPDAKRLKIRSKLEIFLQNHRLIHENTSLDEICCLSKKEYSPEFEQKYRFLVEYSQNILLEAINDQ